MRKIRIPVITVTAFFILLSLLAIGCQRAKVGTPGYQDPFEDRSAFQPAEEYAYLTDIDRGKDLVSERAAEMEQPAGQVSGAEAENPDPSVFFAALGISDLNQKELTAEANNSLIHSHSSYEFPADEESFLSVLNGIGTAEVGLPAHFPRERLASHLFIAKPAELVKSAYDSMERELSSVPSDMPGMELSAGMDSMMQFMGFENAAETYEWMGDECAMIGITNPDFDPQGEMNAENTAFYSVLAISTDSPEDGLDVIQKLLVFPTMFAGGADVLNRDEIDGHDALILDLGTLSGAAMSDMPDEEQTREMEKSMEDVPPVVAVAMEGCIFIGDQPSVEKAMGLFTPRAASTDRTATIEVQSDWDLSLQSLLSDNPGVWLSLAQELSPESKELFDKLLEAIKDIQEIGASRMDIVVDNGLLNVDLWTSKESIRLFEKVQQVIEETPGATWQELGRSIGETLRGRRRQSDQDYSYNFED